MEHDSESPQAATVDREKPKYTVRIAAKRTGLPPATLRAWEKRYGVPAPARTFSRYRLYSDHDLGEIQWMKVRVEEGIPPRQAAHLARERRAAGLAFTGVPTFEAAGLVSDLKAACLAYDEDRAQEVVRRAATVMRPTEIMRAVLLAAVAQIGRDWEAGLVTPAQEHFASQLARRFAGRLMDLFHERAATGTAIFAGAPSEQHDLGLLTLAVEARARGMRVIYLGADVPVDALMSAVRELRPDVVVVGATLDEHLVPWIAAASAIARVAAKTRFVWAGPGARAAEGSALPGAAATSLEDAIRAIFAGSPGGSPSRRRRGAA